MSGCLILVGTPIGNRGDLSPRARDAITGADELWCEDTRSPNRLLPDVQLPPRTSCFVGNEHGRLVRLRAALEEGKRVAFISEAGMPVWSDPGRQLVETAWELGAEIDVIPGPSAATVALAASGFAAEGATFWGFAPRKGSEREQVLERVAASTGAAIFYEAGNRVAGLVADLAKFEVLAVRPVMIGRELTKAHQELRRGVVAQLATDLSSLRGEVTVVVGPGEAAAQLDPQALANEVLELVLGRPETGKPRARARRLAELTGRPARELYALLIDDG